MLKGVKRWLDDNKDRKEQQRLEADRIRQEAIQEEKEQRRQKLELQGKVLAILEEGKVPDLGLDISVPFKLQKNERWLLAVDNVLYAEMRTKREIQGGQYSATRDS